jgi:thiol-disulfide isomerase/thioredoxin
MKTVYLLNFFLPVLFFTSLSLNGVDSKFSIDTSKKPIEFYTIKGVVKDLDGELLKGAQIRLVQGGTQKDIVNTEFAEGEFEINFKPGGSYHLFIRKEGFKGIAVPVVDEFLQGELELILVLGERNSSIESNKELYDFFVEANDRISDRESQMVGRLMAYYNTAAQEKGSFTPINYSKDIEELEEKIYRILDDNSEQEKLKILLIEYLSLKGIQSKVKINNKIFIGEIASSLAEEAIRVIEPESNFWYLYPESIYAIPLVEPAALVNLQDYLDAMIEGNNSEYIVSQSVLLLLRASKHLEQELFFQEYLGKLLSFYPTTAAAFKAKSDFDLPSSLEVGNTIPPFSISNLDVPGVAITEQMMLGKYYLMDFWSTSCGGCIQAMPDHSDMYEKYKGRNFTILSISLDEDQNRITDFRENRYPMPWLNGIAVDGFRDKIAQDFEIGWLPRLYLINPDGVIVAKDDELRGYNLEETLSKYLE